METRSRGARVWRIIQDEAREVIWLLSVVGGLSVLGVAVAVVFAAVQ